MQHINLLLALYCAVNNILFSEHLDSLTLHSLSFIMTVFFY